MGNGDNEQIQFTRSDSDRLTRVEKDTGFIKKKMEDCLELKPQVTRNTTWIKALRWGFSTITIFLLGTIIKLLMT